MIFPLFMNWVTGDYQSSVFVSRTTSSPCLCLNMIIIKYIYHDHNNMIMYHGYNFQRQLQATNLVVMKRRKQAYHYTHPKTDGK